MKKIIIYTLLVLLICSCSAALARDAQSPSEVVSSVLESFINFTGMEQVHNCFLNPEVKQKMLFSLILGGIKDYQILAEDFRGKRAIVKVKVDKEHVTEIKVFILVNCRGRWIIEGNDESI